MGHKQRIRATSRTTGPIIIHRIGLLHVGYVHVYLRKVMEWYERQILAPPIRQIDNYTFTLIGNG